MITKTPGALIAIIVSLLVVGTQDSFAGISIAEAKNRQLVAAGGGQVRAFVVGINAYSSRSVPTLKGAVADARDLETTLRASGVTDLTVLIDANATRRNFETAMQRLIDVSGTGDLVIISFAGQASQQPELVKGSETDGMDEVFVLSNFERSGPGTAERIIDDEMNHWLLQLVKKKVDVLFIADTSHGGGMLDGIPPPDDLKPVDTLEDELKPIDMLGRHETLSRPDVTFLAGADKYSKVPEVSIPGIPTLRGALSYAVTRAIDRGQDGAMTRRQLFGFARQIAYQYSQTKQVIATEPAGDAANLDKVVFRLKVSGETGGASADSSVRSPSAAEAGAKADVVADPRAAALEAEISTRIIGGERAASDAWPAQVALYIRSNNTGFARICGGSLIDPRWVLTAAHCIGSLEPDDYAIVEGTNHIDNLLKKKGPGRIVLVRRVIRHEGYNQQTHENDVALLELASPAAAKPIRLSFPEKNLLETAGTMATVTGWGTVQFIRGGRDATTGEIVQDDDPKYFSNDLMQVELPLVSEEVCQRSYPSTKIDHRMICAGLPEGGKDACQGWGGGPLMVKTADGEFKQIGIVSFGRQCGARDAYGVYTRVSSLQDWLQQKTQIPLGQDASPSVPTSDIAVAPPQPPVPPVSPHRVRP